jgi:hypothetical protein
MRRMLTLTAMVVGTVLAVASPASAATIVVSPATVPTAGTVTLSGDVLANGTPGCAVPETVTLISGAFAGLSEFAGQGAVDLPVDATGHFSSAVTIKSSVAAGTYTITGRCGGGNLGVSASLTVTGLPRTGASFGPLSISDGLALCLALGALGVALTRAGRRREPVPATGRRDRSPSTR